MNQGSVDSDQARVADCLILLGLSVERKNAFGKLEVSKFFDEIAKQFDTVQLFLLFIKPELVDCTSCRCV